MSMKGGGVMPGKGADRGAKDVYAAHAEVLHVLSNPVRHEIVHRLAAGPQSATSLVALTGASKANVSQHLALLRTHGLVTAERRGRSVTFTLAYPQLGQACQLIDEILADQASRNVRLFSGRTERRRSQQT
jgi:DNA-binding transcriptional ArsR family regulator